MKIYDEAALRKFLALTLPVLQDDEVLIYFVFVRKKYCPEVKNHHQMVFRDIIRDADIEALIQRIKNIPSKFLNYETGEVYKEDCYSCYIDLNPKSCMKASNLFIKQVNDLFYQCIKDPKRKTEFNMIKKRLMSSIHKSNSRQPYIMVDIDEKDEALLKETYDWVGKESVWTSETHGGYHIIYRKYPDVCKLLYNGIKGIMEVKSEVMTPLIGCKQGGFIVKEYKF